MCVFFILSGKSREAVLEIDPGELNTRDGMKLLYEKLNSLFKVDTNQAALMVHAEILKSILDYRISVLLIAT